MSFELNAWLQEKGYPEVSSKMSEAIASWKSWYQGAVKDFHFYKQWTGQDWVSREKSRLEMSKFIAEDWANLLLNERVKISVDEGFQQRLDELLTETNWYVQANQVIELAFALGTGALVEYLDKDKKARIDQYRADMIAPISWDASGNVTECAFASTCTQERKNAVYVMAHLLNPDGTYRIENYMFEADSSAPMALPDGLEPVVYTNAETPFFQIIRPNIKNNVDLDSPMGMAVIANSISILKALDNAYDSLNNEFTLGKKRILIPVSWAKMMMQRAPKKPGEKGEGQEMMVFDPNDVAFYQLAVDANSKIDKPIEINMELRVEQHEKGILANLSILGKKVGMGCDRYTWDKNAGVKTATEVVSDKSDLYQNLRKHEITLESAIISMVRALASLEGAEQPKEISVNFDDSIIQDSQTELDNAITEISAGIMSKKTVMVKVLGMTEEEADEELQRIADEKKVDAEEVNSLFGAGNQEGFGAEEEEEDEEEPKEKREDGDE